MTYGFKKERVGKVTVERFRESIRLRFTIDGDRKSITVGSYSKENWAAAIARAKEIDTDIAWQRFDTSLAKYGGVAKQVEIAAVRPINELTEITIKEIWENYLSVKGDSLSNNVKNTSVNFINKWISLIQCDRLGISHIAFHIEILKMNYSLSTCTAMFKIFLAAVNMAVRQNKLASNPYSDYKESFKSSEPSERSRKPFEDYEIKRILEAFKNDEFVALHSGYKDSYYYPFVLFLSLTGCRPEDAIPLKWTDIIKHDKGRTVIRFSRAWSGGEMRHGKNNTIRMFPVNAQLQECLDLAARNGNKCELIFPSQKGKKIPLKNFTRYTFGKVIDGLLAKGEIENDLPTYNIRHTFITRMIRKGIDIATIASLVGNSPEKILTHYLGSNQGIELPELD